MPFHDYIKAQRANLDSALRFELFAATCPLMDKLYETAVTAMPADRSPVFGQFLLICHKSFLAAATLIGQAQPDDAGPVTRRAIEVVRMAAAIKADPDVAEAWAAHEKRMERWRARDRGEKPRALHVPIPIRHPLVKQLMDSWGVISDTEVHFTPEYLQTLKWQQRGDSMFLHYFTGEQRTIERAIIHLLGAHMMMLRVLDDCLDGAFSSHEAWRQLSNDIFTRAKPWAAKFGHADAEDGSDAAFSAAEPSPASGNAS